MGLLDRILGRNGNKTVDLYSPKNEAKRIARQNGDARPPILETYLKGICDEFRNQAWEDFNSYRPEDEEAKTKKLFETWEKIRVFNDRANLIRAMVGYDYKRGCYEYEAITAILKMPNETVDQLLNKLN